MSNEIRHIGLVVIGRNEGERLKNCLASIPSGIGAVVYVDSGSSDDSVAHAKSIGVEVIQLDMSIPFSAGRARNEGFKLLTEKYDYIRYVQFVDGDCELCSDWIYTAHAYLEKNHTCAIVAGRRKEKFPEQSVYNLLCDIEWNTPVGPTQACGGDFMIRAEAFRHVNGFNPVIIAGEEPEMCYRLRKNNWSIYRLNHPMTLHDAAITRFSQWWKRTLRTGHAYAQGYKHHAQDKQGYCFQQSVRIWLWAFFYPSFFILLALLTTPYFFLLSTAYLVLFIKIAIQMYKRTQRAKSAIIYAFFTVIAKFPQLVGQIVFWKKQMMKKKITIIEYN